MAGVHSIEPVKPTVRPGTQLCDPRCVFLPTTRTCARDVQTIAILREDRDALQQRVEELEARIALQEREYLEAPIETD
jgi:hypothetical protein